MCSSRRLNRDDNASPSPVVRGLGNNPVTAMHCRLYDRMVTQQSKELAVFLAAKQQIGNGRGNRDTLFKVFCHRVWAPCTTPLVGERLLSFLNGYSRHDGDLVDRNPYK
jgi:hypothetical protein